MVKYEAGAFETAFPVSNATFLPPVIVATEAIWIFCKKIFLTLFVLELSEYSLLISSNVAGKRTINLRQQQSK